MNKRIAIFLVFLFVSAGPAVAQGFLGFERTADIIQLLVNEHGFDENEVTRWLEKGDYREQPVKSLAAPAEKTRTYAQYRPLFVSAVSIARGKEFLAINRALLTKAREQYGVPEEVIVAILGVETKYGRSRGRHNTFDSLATLAVTEGRRADYFKREFIRFLVVMRDQGLNPTKMKGSYAGATGYPQFMPTSYQAYAVDHDEDGDIDIWSDQYDAIGSIANYLKENGWQAEEPFLTPANTDDGPVAIKVNSLAKDRTVSDAINAGWSFDTKGMSEERFVFPLVYDKKDSRHHYIGFQNFWVISRYNRSISYTLAVAQLAQAIGSGS